MANAIMAAMLTRISKQQKTSVQERFALDIGPLLTY